jgi:hypothetical protein
LIISQTVTFILKNCLAYKNTEKRNTGRKEGREEVNWKEKRPGLHSWANLNKCEP